MLLPRAGTRAGHLSQWSPQGVRAWWVAFSAQRPPGLLSLLPAPSLPWHWSLSKCMLVDWHGRFCSHLGSKGRWPMAASAPRIPRCTAASLRPPSLCWSAPAPALLPPRRSPRPRHHWHLGKRRNTCGDTVLHGGEVQLLFHGSFGGGMGVWGKEIVGAHSIQVIFLPELVYRRQLSLFNRACRVKL